MIPSPHHADTLSADPLQLPRVTGSLKAALRRANLAFSGGRNAGRDPGMDSRVLNALGPASGLVFSPRMEDFSGGPKPACSATPRIRGGRSFVARAPTWFLRQLKMATLARLIPPAVCARTTTTRPQRSRQRPLFCRLALAAACAGGLPPDAAIAAQLPDAALQAAGLIKIVSFVEWPPEVFATADAPLVVGIFGYGSTADLLPVFAAGETWNGRRIIVRRLASPVLADDCHVVFIARSQHSNWRFVRPEFARRPVLTVSTADDFARNEGVVQLATRRKRLRLIINLAAAQTAGVTISSTVLRLAEVIGESPP
jgi:hypothetical protein